MKQNRVDSKEEVEFKKKLSGIHNSLELKNIKEDPKEFLNTLKSELLDDEVYIFTPKGDIKVLPRGATAIDFAYSIHEQIGNHMKGCKINSIDMPLITKLKNGDIVEIRTTNEKIKPEEEWIELLKTAKAKSQILKLLVQKREKNKKEISIEIIAEDRKNLVLEITDVFTKGNINIKSLTTILDYDKAKINMAIEVNKNENINRLLESVKKVNSVKKISWKNT